MKKLCKSTLMLLGVILTSSLLMIGCSNDQDAPVPEKQNPLFSASVNSDKSSWNYICLDLDYADNCQSAYIKSMLTSDYDEMVAQHPGWTADDYYTNGEKFYELSLIDEVCYLYVSSNVEYTIIILCYDEQGEYESVTLTYTAVAEFTDRYEVNIEDVNFVPCGDTTLECDVNFSIKFSEGVKFVSYNMVNGSVDMYLQSGMTILDLVGMSSVDVTGDSWSGSFPNTPTNSVFSIIVVVEGEDGELAYDVQEISTTL